jgi:hypothetical protein
VVPDPATPRGCRRRFPCHRFGESGAGERRSDFGTVPMSCAHDAVVSGEFCKIFPV